MFDRCPVCDQRITVREGKVGVCATCEARSRHEIEEYVEDRQKRWNPQKFEVRVRSDCVAVRWPTEEEKMEERPMLGACRACGALADDESLHKCVACGAVRLRAYQSHLSRRSLDRGEIAYWVFCGRRRVKRIVRIDLPGKRLEESKWCVSGLGSFESLRAAERAVVAADAHRRQKKEGKR